MADGEFREMPAYKLQVGDVLALPFGRTATIHEVWGNRLRTFFLIQGEKGTRSVPRNHPMLVMNSTQAVPAAHTPEAVEIAKTTNLVDKTSRILNDIESDVQDIRKLIFALSTTVESQEIRQETLDELTRLENELDTVRVNLADYWHDGTK